MLVWLFRLKFYKHIPNMFQILVHSNMFSPFSPQLGIQF